MIKKSTKETVTPQYKYQKMNNNTLKRQLWSNKNIRNYLNKDNINIENMRLLGRIQSARSHLTANDFRDFEETHKQYKRNIKSKYGTND